MIIPTIRIKNNNTQQHIDESNKKIQQHDEHDDEGTEQIRLLRDACENVGFFCLEVRDGDLRKLRQRVFHQSKLFFALPSDIKNRCSDHVLSRGYTAMGEETLDPSNQVTGDTKEGYYIGQDVPEGDPRYNPAKLSGPNVYPTPEMFVAETRQQFDCEQWKNTMTEYHESMKDLAVRLVRMLALALQLERTHFDPHFRDPLALLRLLHYSNQPSDADNGVFACGAHSDYGMLTILAMDSPGLQIYHGNEWIDVPYLPDSPAGTTSTFVVNLGDMLERWTNGIFKSTLHRVLVSSSSSSTDDDDDDKNDEEKKNDAGEGGESFSSINNNDRYSIPFFFEPSFDTVVECLENCLGEDGPKYPPTTSGQHLIDKYKETHSDFDQGSS